MVALRRDKRKEPRSEGSVQYIIVYIPQNRRYQNTCLEAWRWGFDSYLQGSPELGQTDGVNQDQEDEQGGEESHHGGGQQHQQGQGHQAHHHQTHIPGGRICVANREHMCTIYITKVYRKKLLQQKMTTFQ